jgi:hypothetical protein
MLLVPLWLAPMLLLLPDWRSGLLPWLAACVWYVTRAGG